jgi:hypothetical protein
MGSREVGELKEASRIMTPASGMTSDLAFSCPFGKNSSQ